MPLFDFECPKCKLIFEWMIKINEDTAKCPVCFDEDCPKVWLGKSPSFKLTYNPKTDIVDWDGNRSKYWDEYKKMKKEGKKPRIPALDGE